MRSVLLTIRAGFACLALTSTAAVAQQLGSEPRPLSRAIQVAAQPLSAAPMNAHARPAGNEKQPLPSFPFRQVGAQEVVAAGQSSTDAPSSSVPAGGSRKLTPRKSVAHRSPGHTAAPTPSTAIGTVVSSLAIVLGLFAGLVWLTRRMAPAGSAALPKEAVELLGRAPLAGRQSMQLVRIGNRILLVALSPTGAQTLTEITDPVEVEHLAALCQRGKSNSASATFNGVLRRLASEPGNDPPRSRARGAA
jgi:flagellar protein FliO/FliZ